VAGDIDKPDDVVSEIELTDLETLAKEGEKEVDKIPGEDGFFGGNLEKRLAHKLVLFDQRLNDLEGLLGWQQVSNDATRRVVEDLTVIVEKLDSSLAGANIAAESFSRSVDVVVKAVDRLRLFKPDAIDIEALMVCKDLVEVINRLPKITQDLYSEMNVSIARYVKTIKAIQSARES
jgi:hypothetical protein